MKIVITAIAGLLLAATAAAQTIAPPSPSAPETPPVTQTPVAPPAEAPPPAPPAEAPPAEAAPSAQPDAPALVLKDGKWWKGDRRASKTEIAEYRRHQPK